MTYIDLTLSIINNFLSIADTITKRYLKKTKYIYIKEEDAKIDCIDFLKQYESTNRKMIPYEINKQYIVFENSIEKYVTVYAKSAINTLSTYDFIIASSDKKSHNEIEYYGYDLNFAPEIKITPKLIKPDGYAKKLSLQLNSSVNKGEDIKLRIVYKNKNTKHHKYIFTEGLNYRKYDLKEYTISIEFQGVNPEYISVYEVNDKKYTYSFKYKFYPQDFNGNEKIFIDRIDNTNVKSYIKRAYIFSIKKEDNLWVN